MRQSVCFRAKRILPMLIFLGCLGITVGFYALHGRHNLDSDISSEFVLAQLLNEEGRFFLTDSWYYSTELRIVSPVPLYQIMLRLFDSWHAARTVSIGVLLLGVGMSLMYMVRALSVSSRAALLCAAALVLRMKLGARERLAAVFMPVALGMGMLINVLTLIEDHDVPMPYSVSYYMPAALLLVFALFWLLDRFACKLEALRVLLMLALVGVFLAGTACYRQRNMYAYPTEMERIAQYLLDEDCVQGYATFWNANVLTELTDGEIEVCSVEDWTSGAFNRWLQRKDHENWAPEGRVFAIFKPEDLESGVPGCDEEHLFYSSDTVCVAIYESNEAFMAARAGGA